MLKKVSFALATVSTSRFIDFAQRRNPEDVSGRLADAIIRGHGHEVTAKVILPDNKRMIQGFLEFVAEKNLADAVVYIGGTGLTPDDVTPDALLEIADKVIYGFGELFRQIVFRERGTRALLTRAVAIVFRGVIAFAVPGAPEAVETALKKLILPEIAHLVGHVKGIHEHGREG